MFDEITDNDIRIDHCDILSSLDLKRTPKGVQNSLRNHYALGGNIGTFDHILSIMKTGYNISFVNNPPKIHMKNNLSVLQNCTFVSESVEDLIESGCIVQVPFKPFVVSPLSVAQKREKKRLILDLSVLNFYVKKENLKITKLFYNILRKMFTVSISTLNQGTIILIFVMNVRHFSVLNGTVNISVLQCFHSVYHRLFTSSLNV